MTSNQTAANDRAVRRINIPVFFMTDRNMEQPSKNGDVKFGIHRKYLGKCEHEVYMGVAVCSINNSRHKKLGETLQDLGWTKSPSSKEKVESVSLSPGASYKEIGPGFFDKVYKYSSLTPEHAVWIFVPGYFSTFESGVRSAARLSYFAERPVILYSWPSMGEVVAYPADEASIEWSQYHFNDFLDKIAELGTRENPLQARVVSHSMGNRLVLRATPKIIENKAIRELNLVCPDDDDGVMRHYADQYGECNSGLLVRLYLSNKDKLLVLSQAIHGGYVRFGQNSSPLSNFFSGQSIPDPVNEPVGKNKAVDNIFKCSSDLPKLDTVQTIIYSDIDISVPGHKIPAELITDLSHCRKLRPELKFIVEKVHKSSAGKKHITSYHQNEIEDDNDEKGTVLEVFDTSWSSRMPIIGAIKKRRPHWNSLIHKDWTIG